MRLFMLLLVLCAGLAAAPSVRAETRSEAIAAVVNEEAITMSDVEDRMNLIIASSGLPNTKEIKSKLAGQVIGGLIEERIKLQEATRLGIDIKQEDIDAGFADIAKQNNFKPEQFAGMLAQAGINIGTLQNQIEAQIAWLRLVQQELRPRIAVSDKDVDDTLARLKANAGKTEYLVAEIFLPVDDPKAEGDTHQLAARLVSEITSGKAPFSKVAQQFSKAPGADQGGDLGWVQQGQLPQELENAVKTMAPGTFSPPVRSLSGYHILSLREVRTISATTMPSREQVVTNIGTQRLEREQRRYYLDLKSASFIENRVEI